MKQFVIKGVYLKGKNPTYYGTLDGCIEYVNNENFTFYGEDIEIYDGDYIVAIQKWIKKVDSVGEYWESQEWIKIKNKKEYTKSKEWSDRYFGNLKKGILPF